MIFSVYDYPSGKYRYYEAPAQLPAAGWFRQPLGSVPVPESIAARLPASAKPIGQGDKARGIIATTQSPTGIGFSYSSLSNRVPSSIKMLALLGIGFWVGKKYR